MTRRLSHTLQRAEWKRAGAESRIVSFDDGLTMRSYLTHGEAQQAAHLARQAGREAHVVTFAPIDIVDK